MAPYTFGNTLLKVEDVHLTLGGRPILRGVNAEIRDVHRPGLTQGQVVGVLGPSGIGKTQLFRILSGLNKPTSGKVLVTEKGVPVRPGMVGVVAQSYPLFEHRDVMGNLTVAGRQAGLSPDAARKKAHKLLERFLLKDKEHFWPAELSGGQRQRIAIAQQLMCSEHFLLMDEPFSGLDPIMKDEACRLITDVAAADELATIIVVTHDIGSAIQVSDTLWCVGRDRDVNGEIVPGAYIKATYDLMARGLAWRPEITTTPEFADCVREIRSVFETL